MGKYPAPVPGFSNCNQVLWIRDKALTVCKGRGIDIGCEHEGNKLPGALGVSIGKAPGIDYVGYAEDFINLFKPGEFDYVFSSHCLEHIENWEKALEYWMYPLKSGGAFFLYLPNPAVAPEWSKVNLHTHKHDFILHMVLEKLIHYPIEIIECAYDVYAAFYIYGVKK